MRDRYESLLAMLADVMAGRVPDVSRGRIAAVFAALLYIIMPLDFFPEALLGPLGLLDDTVVVAWIAAAFVDSTNRYLVWKNTPGTGYTATTPPTGTSATDAGPIHAEYIRVDEPRK